MAPRSLPLCLLALLLWSAGCVSTTPPPRPTTGDLASVKRLAIVVPAVGAFGVFHSRAEGASPGGSAAVIGAGAAFGVVGALVATGVASAVVQSQDDKRTEQVKPHVATYSPRSVFVGKLTETLRDAKRFDQVDAFEGAPGSREVERFDALVTVEVRDWGLRLVPNREGDALTGFVEIATKMTMVSGGRIVWEERQSISGQRRHPLADWVADAELLRSELTETLETAGNRVAVELMYPRGTR